MADGMNNVRAIRLAEILLEFLNLQRSLNEMSTISAYGGFGIENLGEGHILLLECFDECKAVLDAPFDASAPAPNGDVEKEKAQLQRVIADASVRRFQAHRIYLRAKAAEWWINSRNAILLGQEPTMQHESALAEIDEILRQELELVTQERVLQDIRSNDQQQGKWIEEDPDLFTILQWIVNWC